jgi:DUF1009 family protein
MPASAPIGIVAGAGSLPLHVAASAARSGRAVFVAALSGSARREDFASFDCEAFGLGQLGGLLNAFQCRGVTEAAFIGAVVRPGLRDIKPDFGLVKHWSSLVGAFRKGDDGLLSAIIGIVEGQGVRVVSALDLAPDLAVLEAGRLGRVVPNPDAEDEINVGLNLIAALSPFDVGQCVVVSDGRPVAIEGAEGTDAMLARVAEMRRNGRLSRDTGGGVLVKAPKQGQSMRIDIPTIGPTTVRNAAAAGLQGIAISVGSVLVAEREAAVKLADELGLFIEARP